MKTHPDIEDIDDVGRYCFNNAFPVSFAPNGECTEVFIPVDIGRQRVIGTTVSGQTRDDRKLTLEEFIALDTGPHKARMVETKFGSVVYVSNRDVNARFHGFGHYNVKYFHGEHPNYDRQLREFTALELLNKHRTPWSQGRNLLEEGHRIGIALSDRFGVVTLDSSEAPCLVYKTRIIGTIVRDRTDLIDTHSHLASVVSSLLSK